MFRKWKAKAKKVGTKRGEFPGRKCAHWDESVEEGLEKQRTEIGDCVVSGAGTRTGVKKLGWDRCFILHYEFNFCQKKRKGKKRGMCVDTWVAYG